MRTYKEALEYSKKNPTEIVEFREEYLDRSTQWLGFLLNGHHEGISDSYQNYPNVLDFRDIYNSKTSHAEVFCFWDDGSTARWHYFTRKDIMHGECIYYNEDGVISDNYFSINGGRVKELDYLVNEERDDAFYVTLSLYGIDKEYTIGA